MMRRTGEMGHDRGNKGKGAYGEDVDVKMAEGQQGG